MRKFLFAALVAALLLAGLAVGEAQISIPYSFSSGQVISSAQVNANFSTLGLNACNLTGCTMQGVFTTLGIVPASTNTYDLGTSSTKYKDGYFAGIVNMGSLVTTGTTTFNTIAYTWPSSQTATYFLQTNGSGTLSWALAGSPVVTATKVATYTAAVNEFVVANGTFTVNLPAASGNSGKIIDVKNIGTGTITIDANASETIDGALTQTLSIQYQSMTLICDGSNWYIR